MIYLAAIVCLALIGFFWLRRLSLDLQKSFQSMSYEVMERNNRTFLDLARTVLEKYQDGAKGDLESRQKSFESLLVPLRDTIKLLDEHQRDLEKRREGAYASITKQIETLALGEKELRQETSKLSSALRSPPIRGAWGQVHLRRVVELAGLLQHCDFFEQTTIETEGKIQRPDLVVHLPGQRQIVVDAKTPLSAYFEASDATDEAVRVKKLQEHAQQLRDHMRDLSRKDYWKRFDLTPEFVILFLPAEAFFSAALQADPSLIEAGAGQNVIVAAPTTLIAILRAVAHGWKQEAISKNAEQTAALGQELFERLCLLSDYWNKMGRSLNNAVESYNQAVSSLESRVFVSARKLKDHGAAPLHKDLPAPEPIEKLARIHEQR